MNHFEKWIEENEVQDIPYRNKTIRTASSRQKLILDVSCMHTAHHRYYEYPSDTRWEYIYQTIGKDEKNTK